MKNIVISFSEGRVVRDWFYSGFIDKVIEKGINIDAFTPATKVHSFTCQWKRKDLIFHSLDRYFLSNKELRILSVQNMLVNHLHFLLPLFAKVQANWLMPPSNMVLNGMRAIHPDLVVISNPLEHYEYPVSSAAKKIGVPTLGVIRSWDNLYKGLRIRPDFLAVWSQINKEEACKIMKYDPGRVIVVGATQFDPYFAPNSIWSREKFAEAFELDPSYPIITLATLGSFQHQYDETYLLDQLISARDKGEIPQKSQIICRLHPSTQTQFFLPYLKTPNVRLSFMSSYIPTLSWTMTRDEVVLVANLLRHSDVVVSPGSTITIETAAFDTPTIVPIYHTYQPEVAKRQYDWHMANHFGRLKTENLVPIIEKSEDLSPAISRALNDRSWYREQRKRLVADYIQFTDGRSSDRLISLIGKLIEKK